MAFDQVRIMTLGRVIVSYITVTPLRHIRTPR